MNLRDRLKVHADWLDKHLDYMEAEVLLCVEVDAVLSAVEAWARADQALTGIIARINDKTQDPAEFGPLFTALCQRRRDLLALTPARSGPPTLE